MLLSSDFKKVAGDRLESSRWLRRNEAILAFVIDANRAAAVTQI